MSKSNEKLYDRLSDIRAILLEDYPFFGELAMRLRLEVENCSTAYTDMERIVVDPEFANNLSDEELGFVMMHEVMHCCLQHPIRGRDRFHIIYNIAADIVVNSNIINVIHKNDYSVNGKDVIHKTPKGREGYFYNVDQVYEMLCNTEPYLSFIKHGKDLSDDIVELIFDNHDNWEEVGISQKTKHKWDLLARQFGSDLWGDSTPYAIRLVSEDAEKKAKLKWIDILEEFIEENIFFTDHTFNPPDRRLISEDFFLPGDNLYLEENIQNIWFCIDTSGSISPIVLNRLYGEVKNITNQINNCKGLVSFFDVYVTEPQLFTAIEDFDAIIPQGGGGTSFKGIFDHLNDYFESDLPNALIILTDGYATDVDEECAMGIPVMWIIVDNEDDKKWGQTIHIFSGDF